MKLLIIEDDGFKLDQLAKFAKCELPGAEIAERRSYQSGLKEAVESPASILLLDMSLPNFDITATETGYVTRLFAGRDILNELVRHGVA